MVESAKQPVLFSSWEFFALGRQRVVVFVLSRHSSISCEGVGCMCVPEQYM